MTMKITGHQDAKVLVLVAVSNYMAIYRVKRGRVGGRFDWNVRRRHFDSLKESFQFVLQLDK